MGPSVNALCAPSVLIVSSADVIPQLRMGPQVPFLSVDSSTLSSEVLVLLLLSTLRKNN